MKLVRIPYCKYDIYVNADLVEYIRTDQNGTYIVTSSNGVIHTELSADKVAALLSGNLTMQIGEEIYE
ncbi:MAG: hypothetical protein IIZ09_14045 [Ruminococcus sp.]|nr:hypothetical protein [Ruminococcus sp.]